MPDTPASDIERLDADLLALGEQTAAEARAFLSVVREVAGGAVPDSAVPVLSLALSQVLVTGTRLGVINDVVPQDRFETDLGSDEDVESLRLELTALFQGIDEYVDVIDPLTTGEVTSSRVSDDLADVCAALLHGLRHHADGRLTEALWWWQFSYLATWGARAASALRVMQSILGHIRLDADEDTVAEAQFDALHR
ncbi:DUF5063 domain-containing protein [Mobilicoccus pelagius]|uniref:DUF5063 domain-containing protein n=1 Tax=Mobilicoccus pelagius NBRC 104925 TaxID=1089455 RepID=H5UQY1_9MICO|nr:DUF5063 domain-containing protein [Mobilicoccus pelagius]GAB48139.1 hypothetical protein MOPEL_060_00560 [Mobilicoccus pelagius NBRC 104925]